MQRKRPHSYKCLLYAAIPSWLAIECNNTRLLADFTFMNQFSSIAQKRYSTKHVTANNIEWSVVRDSNSRKFAANTSRYLTG